MVATTFLFRKGGFDGENPKGFSGTVKAMEYGKYSSSKSVKTEYVIVYVNNNSAQTIISRSKRYIFWILLREPPIPEKYL